MDSFVLGLLIGILAGILVGCMYDHWKVQKIVDYAILSYRIDEAKKKKERLQKFIDDQGDDAE
jgi:hypothetical protein